MKKNLLSITQSQVPKSTQWARDNPQKVAEQQRRVRNTLRGAVNGKVSAARQRARNKGLDFDIDIDFIIELFEAQDRKCALTGREMGLRADKGTPETFNSFSIDRIDSSKGYTKDNVQLLCWGVNSIKNVMSQDAFLMFVEEVYNYNKLGGQSEG